MAYRTSAPTLEVGILQDNKIAQFFYQLPHHQSPLPSLQHYYRTSREFLHSPTQPCRHGVDVPEPIASGGAVVLTRAGVKLNPVLVRHS
ncbi:unnamed protein product [Allacma fusca]|uniref:Uncharacterized protein n=1 Tax=Allacma fusca TaxID=39272 RepID=A0A8J2JRN4_9HEXA|nr:unnamed protein product [Allacma fusca]